MKPLRRQAKPARKQPVRHRRRRRRVINAPRLILSLLLILLVGEAVLATLTSPWFEISNVRVYGRKLVAREFVTRCTQVPAESNIFLFKPESIARRLRPDPIIERVTVSRRLPDTLVVRITERKADLMLNTHRKHYEVDAMGIPFRIVEKPNPRLTVVSCKVPQSITLGKPIKTSAFLSAVECLRLARQRKNFPVGKITVDQNNDLCLNVRDGLLVRLGQHQHLEDKLDKAKQTIELGPDLEYVDVTCPEAPAFKPRESDADQP